MTCACGRTPDPGICPISHGGRTAGGHCACTHTVDDRASIHQAATEKIRALAGSLHFEVGTRVLAALDEPATDNGPTVAEAAKDDRRWPLQKAGE